MIPGKTYTPADILTMVRRRRAFIVIPILVGLYAGLVVSSLRHEQYESEMLIQVVPQRVPDTLVQTTVTMRVEDRLNALQQETLSRTTLERIIREMHLYSDELQHLPMEDVVDRMRRDCKVEPVLKAIGNTRDADSFYVRFRYRDPEIARQVTDRLGGLFIELNMQDRGKTSQDVDQFLQATLGEKRKTLEQTEAKLERFRQLNAGRLPDQVDFNMQAITTTQGAIFSLTATIQQDRNQKQLLESRVRDGEAELAGTSRSVVAPSTGPSAKEQLESARAELAKLLITLKPEHPTVGAKRRQITRLEQAAAAESGSPAPIAAAVETPEYAARRARLEEDREKLASLVRTIEFNENAEKNLRLKLAEHQRHLEQVPGVTSEWTALTRDYTTQKTDYEELLKKSSQSNVAVELERKQIGEQFKVLDAARLPSRPTGLPRVAVNGGGAALGLVLGILLAAFLELRDTSYSTAEDIAGVLQLPVVAFVPYIASDADRRRTRRRRDFASAAAVTLCIIGGYGVWALELWKHVV